MPENLMDTDVLLEVEHASKRFARSLKRALWYGVRDLTGELLGRSNNRSELRPGEFWAVDDVSFQVSRGECVGLIGPNGAGKSTLLKMLTGLIKPDRGRITARGRVGSLIELGAGFNPILTGRENIYISAAVHGISKREVDRNFDEIVDFAEIEDFLDMPIQSYSSGMKVRLGFAVASQIRPDLFLVDEVLAVGDVGFRAKCYNRISDLLENSAVVFVSHSMGHIHRYCNRVLVLDHGKPYFLGETTEGVDTYCSLFKRQAIHKACEGNALEQLELLDQHDQPVSIIRHGETLRIRIQAKIDPAVRHPVTLLTFFNYGFQPVANCYSPDGFIDNQDGTVDVTVDIGPLILNPGNYRISLLVFDETMRKHLIWHDAHWDIGITGARIDRGGAAIQFDAAWTQARRRMAS